MPFYMTWYPARWIPSFRAYGEFDVLATHVRWASRASRRLGRALFHAMVRFGPKLEKRQMVLFRAVDIGAELFAMMATCSRAMQLAKSGNANAAELADAFCFESRQRIEASFRTLFSKQDMPRYRLAQKVAAGDYEWLEKLGA
jgi:hypothetical protein